jgi:predicted PurR-regulated permease PerM
VLLPIVRGVECLEDHRGRHLPRGAAAAIVILALLLLLVYVIVHAAPRLAAEIANFATEAPLTFTRAVDAIDHYSTAHGMSAFVDPWLDRARDNTSAMLQRFGGMLVAWVGRQFGNLGELIGLMLVPVLAYYLLADSPAVQASALALLPKRTRDEFVGLRGPVDRALRSYVRGQSIVCVVMGTCTGLALAIFQHPVALLLGLVAGLVEVVPILGYIVAVVTIGLAGFSVGIKQAIIGVAVYTAVNWAVGALITPRLMGRFLKLHPFLVTVSVLAGARLLGPPGALLALPSVAVLQAAISARAQARGEEDPIAAA